MKYDIENISLHAIDQLDYCGFIKTAQQRVVLFCHKVQGLHAHVLATQQIQVQRLWLIISTL
jgi:hypothetical protein